MTSHLPAISSPAATEDPDGDPFTLEVIKIFLLAVGDEMFAAQPQTSVSHGGSRAEGTARPTGSRSSPARGICLTGGERRPGTRLQRDRCSGS
jgi:hypothetical protein